MQLYFNISLTALVSKKFLLLISALDSLMVTSGTAVWDEDNLAFLGLGRINFY